MKEKKLKKRMKTSLNYFKIKAVKNKKSGGWRENGFDED
jgi:hypothetical protein